ncbi:MAG: tripartite tricarboxylate transporter permease [Deltaproteobacteria bacterium]|nr:tripartite tricarboxylate transporter permease [Deltaproteobacteria bacterium]MBI2540797.1 tripartite tricarboxylate transporter permease [Deltaproteobacteria bacterium]
MESLTSLAYGFNIALQPQNLLYCFIGVTMGTLVGVLPGIGPTATVALLLPATFKLDPISAIIMLSGICYGAMYGGSTTSILLNIPGEASSVVTCLDGYQMARQGRAGPALGISAFGSFIAGTFSILGLVVLAPTLAEFALKFGPPEYFSLMVMGLTVVAYLARKSMVKALMMTVLGVILGCIGLDPITATPRFTFGILELTDGIGLAPVVMGLFGIAEVLENLGVLARVEVFAGKIKGLFPNREDWRRSIGPIARGSLLGFSLGLLPGVGAIIPQFLSYGLEKRLSAHPERFGKGEIEGVASPEACNNAAVGGTFIPLLSLGIPSNAMTAILLGALMIYGLTPGPLLIKNSPDLFWGVIASMYIGNILLLILNLPLIPVWVSVLKIPYAYLSSFIILFCLIGAYSLNNSTADIFVAVIFSLLGLLMKKFDFEGAPLVLAFVLGPLLETALRRSLILSDGSFLIFLERPISAGFILFALFVLAVPLFSKIRLGRGLSEED